MRYNSRALTHPHLLGTAILAIALMVTWMAYKPALNASLLFDDYANLSGLAEVDGLSSAANFVAGATTGPTGRPLSVVSFAAQAYAWPDNPEIFRQTNILIHLLNGLLITWFTYLLGRIRNEEEGQAANVAAITGAIWMLLPILASSSLMIIQRMTTLSATWVLLGIVGYLYARRLVDRKPAASLICMSVALAISSSGGVLTKENGVLVFLFVLAIEATLLGRPTAIAIRTWRLWLFTFLLVPLAAILTYLISVLPYSDVIVFRRGFTGLERLVTQAEILWKYLYLAFLPRASYLGPFHDDYQLVRALLASSSFIWVGAWLLAIVLAFSLRRRAPLFGFAVAWYLFGHLLESTTLNLELYFEHRNYLPLIGPVYALVATAARLSKTSRSWRRLTAAAGLAYAGVLVGVLYSTTSLWGSPALAAELWHYHKPNSLRATQHLAGTLERDGYMAASRRLLHKYLEENPEDAGVGLQALVISCHIEPESDHKDAVNLLKSSLRDAEFDYSVVAALRQLQEMTTNEICPSITSTHVYSLGEALLDNPRFRGGRIQHDIHLVMAAVAIAERDFSRSALQIENALDAYYDLFTLRMAVRIFISGGQQDIASGLVQNAKLRDPPRNPLRAIRWKNQLQLLEREFSSLMDGSAPPREH